MLVLLSRESFRVLALESSIKLQEMSRERMVLFIFKNSERDSQNMWPSEFDERDIDSRPELLLSRSVHNLAPPLSSMRLSFRFRKRRLLFTFRA